MKRFVWNAAQSGRILRRHRMLALFLILQCALCLGMAGTVANQAVQSGRKIEDFQTRIGGKRYYTVSESMSETDFTASCMKKICITQSLCISCRR